jgi:hypothetical protein
MFTYKIIGNLKSFDDLKNKVQNFTHEKWINWNGPKTSYTTHINTLTIPVSFQKDIENKVFNYNFYDEELNSLCKNELEEYYNLLKKFYGFGEPKRVQFAMLLAGNNISKHKDRLYHLTNSHRTHLPIITNENVMFYVNDIKVPMSPGIIVEINNNTEHYVNNQSSENRVHLIVDWGKKGDTFYD